MEVTPCPHAKQNGVWYSVTGRKISSLRYDAPKLGRVSTTTVMASSNFLKIAWILITFSHQMASFAMAVEVARYHATRRVIICTELYGHWCYIKADLHTRFAWKSCFYTCHDVSSGRRSTHQYVICQDFFAKYEDKHERRLLSSNKHVAIYVNK